MPVAIRPKKKKDATTPDAGLVALVGGQHESVIETRVSLCHCMLLKKLPETASYCDHCPFRSE